MSLQPPPAPASGGEKERKENMLIFHVNILLDPAASGGEKGRKENMIDFDHNLERLNFLAWYPTATPEEIEIARRNNPGKLEELIEKYKYDLDMWELING